MEPWNGVPLQRERGVKKNNLKNKYPGVHRIVCTIWWHLGAKETI